MDSNPTPRAYLGDFYDNIKSKRRKGLSNFCSKYSSPLLVVKMQRKPSGPLIAWVQIFH